MLTVKELATEIGVSKVAINKKIEALGLKDKLLKDGNRFLLPDDVADLVRQTYKYRKTDTVNEGGSTAQTEGNSTAQTENDPGIYADIIQVLKEQLAEKDKQIERLQMLMAQQNQLLLPDKRDPGEATNEVEAETVSQDTEQPTAEAPKSFWRRLFG